VSTALWLRLPLQLPLVVWAARCARTGTAAGPQGGTGPGVAVGPQPSRLQAPVYGRLEPGVGHKGLGLPRRTLDRFRHDVAAVGFRGTENLSTADCARRIPRWPDVRRDAETSWSA
jgi:hypothetical protein